MGRHLAFACPMSLHCAVLYQDSHLNSSCPHYPYLTDSYYPFGPQQRSLLWWNLTSCHFLLAALGTLTSGTLLQLHTTEIYVPAPQCESPSCLYLCIILKPYYKVGSVSRSTREMSEYGGQGGSRKAGKCSSFILENLQHTIFFL